MNREPTALSTKICAECGFRNRWDSAVCGKCGLQFLPTVGRIDASVIWADPINITCPQGTGILPTDSDERKEIPLARGVLDYFSSALADVAHLSKVGNDKHNPGEDLHHARSKSSDHADCIMRHLAERGTVDTDGILHDTKVAWRALAMLQEELERRGAPKARGAR